MKSSHFLITGFGTLVIAVSGATVIKELNAEPSFQLESNADINPFFYPDTDLTTQDSLADQITTYALKFLGSPYLSSGIAPSGFDCSGFTHFVYSHFNLEMPHGSISQATLGQPIPLTEARKGDLLIFTGTDLSIRTPGHVGIVLENNNQKIRFIHSSSVGGVKISEVQGTRYADRLLQIRRVL